MKDDCLHCVLVKAATKWLKTHNAPTKDICEMVGRAAAQIVGELPEHRTKGVNVIVLGVKYDSAPKETYH